jgi:hypothetical protein
VYQTWSKFYFLLDRVVGRSTNAGGCLVRVFCVTAAAGTKLAYTGGSYFYREIV